jgi:hypothetical protein
MLSEKAISYPRIGEKSMHRQGIPDIDLFVEQDTERTPEPQKFYIIHKGQILGSYRGIKAAITKYNEVKKAIGYIPPSVTNSKSEGLADAITEEWMNRTELYWSKSTSFRTTNKVRR